MRRIVSVVAATTLGLIGPTAALAADHHSASHHSADHHIAGKRPRREHVPASVRKVVVARSNEPATRPTERRRLKGKRAAALVHDFNHLRVRKAGGVTCLIAGGPTTTVTFRAPHHTWVASQSACTDLKVTRDGVALPNLIGSPKWENAVARDLKR